MTGKDKQPAKTVKAKKAKQAQAKTNESVTAKLLKALHMGGQ